MILTVEIFYDDLKTEAQIKLLKAFDTTIEDENWEVQPLAIIEREDDDMKLESAKSKDN